MVSISLLCQGIRMRKMGDRHMLKVQIFCP